MYFCVVFVWFFFLFPLAQESIGISQSLFVLRNVIKSLAAGRREDEGASHYRDSKLTALLKNSLGGNSLTLMVRARFLYVVAVSVNAGLILHTR